MIQKKLFYTLLMLSMVLTFVIPFGTRSVLAEEDEEYDWSEGAIQVDDPDSLHPDLSSIVVAFNISGNQPGEQIVISGARVPPTTVVNGATYLMPVNDSISFEGIPGKAIRIGAGDTHDDALDNAEVSKTGQGMTKGVGQKDINFFITVGNRDNLLEGIKEARVNEDGTASWGDISVQADAAITQASADFPTVGSVFYGKSVVTYDWVSYEGNFAYKCKAKATSGWLAKNVTSGAVNIFCISGNSKKVPGTGSVLDYKTVITYANQETGKVKGYTTYYPRNNTRGFSVDETQIMRNDFSSSVVPPKGRITLRKTSTVPEVVNGNSYYSLTGAKFELKDSKGKVVHRFITDGEGRTDVYEGKPGDYTLTEVTAPKGYEKLTDPLSISISAGKKKTQTVSNKPIPGKVELKKISANHSISKGNSCYSLAGAEYEVYDKNKKAVAKLFTNSEGNTGEAEVWAGTYTVKETKASKGYGLDKTVYTVKVEPGKTATFTSKEPPQNNPVDILAGKIDKETTKAYKQNGATFEGAEFEVKLYPAESVIGEAARTWIFKTDKDGRTALTNPSEYFVSGDDFYYATDGKTPVFPLGTYTIRETKAPKGYLVNDKVETVQVTGTDSGAETVKTYSAPRVPEQVMRYNLDFVKTEDGTQNRMANVPFLLTCTTTSESHVIVTDENGQFNSASLDWTKNTNKNDEAYDTKTGEIDDSKLSADYGFWFGIDEQGNRSKAYADAKGPIVYGEYTLTELASEANAGKVLLKDIKLAFSKPRDGFEVRMGTLTNDWEEPEIKTTATDGVSENHVGIPDSMTIIDKITYHSLQKGKKYTVKGSLMDKASNEPVLIEGKKIEASKTFVAENADGFVELEFIFPAFALIGKSVVAFETLIKDGEEIAFHEDIEDENQTVRYPKIETSLTRSDGRKVFFPAEDVELVDTVKYENLVPGKIYIMEGILMDKENKIANLLEKPLKVKGEEVRASAEFTPERESGEVEITFTFDASELAGKELVAFETCYGIKGEVKGNNEKPGNDEEKPSDLEKVKVAEHKDINDMAQTVKIVEDEKLVTPVNTGDDTSMWAYVGLLLSSAAAAVYMARKRRIN